MQDTFHIAWWMTNKVGDDKFFLMLDYDGVDYNEMLIEINNLQERFSLWDASVYETSSWYHVYFFYDNSFSYKNLKEIMSHTKLVDKNFLSMLKDKKMVMELWLTLRLMWKYKKPDIKEKITIPWKDKTNFLEMNLWDSIVLIHKRLLSNSIIPYKEYSINIDSDGKPWGEKKQWTEETQQTINNVESSFEKEVEEKKKITLREAFPENTEITHLRKIWYNWKYEDIVARLISASTEKRESALNKNRKFWEIKEEWFINYRPFFLDNNKNMHLMKKPYSYVIEKTRLDELPLNFFHSHALLDIDNIPKTPLMDFGKQKETREEISENILSLITWFDIIFDMDCDDPQSDRSYIQTRKLRDLFLKMNIPFSLNFSWSKWFHVRIPAELVNDACPKFIEHLKKDRNNIRKVFDKLIEFTSKNDIEIDEWAYSGDLRSLIRVQWSVHQWTWSIVKPLTDEEFDSLRGKSLEEMQKIYRVDNQMKWNASIGAKKLNFRRNDFIIKIPLDDGNCMTWEEMRDSWKYDKIVDGKKEWENYRSNYTNPITKELRNLAKNERDTLESILEMKEYEWFKISAPEYIFFKNWRNYNYLKEGCLEKLKEFLEGIID